jgi:ribosomal protein S12 methylthiotransferase
MAEFKKKGLEKLVVTGCLPQLCMEELKSGLPEVDLMVGTERYHEIDGLIEGLYENAQCEEQCEPTVCLQTANSAAAEFREASNYIQGRVLTTPAHYAYLKISEGCSNKCTFCLIPKIRGPYRSYGKDNLIAEAKMLADRGVKELILVAQDITAYNDGGADLVDLLAELEKINGIEWLRLMYCYPESVTDRLIDKIAGSEKICKYIDIPFQHADDGVLKLMNRRVSYGQSVKLIERLRKRIPNISIRSSFITGFPGESEEAFGNLCNFVSGMKLSNAGFFTYSREKGTPAYKLPDQVPYAVKRKRLQRLAALQKAVAAEVNAGLVGKTLRVLYEGIDYKKGLFYGRTQYHAPEVDGKIYFKADFADIGNFYDVRITRVRGYDLVGEVRGEKL